MAIVKRFCLLVRIEEMWDSVYVTSDAHISFIGVHVPFKFLSRSRVPLIDFAFSLFPGTLNGPTL